MQVVPNDASEDVSQGWLHQNQPYLVLSVHNHSTGTKYLIWSELQSMPALFSAANFNIVDHCIPTAWIAKTFDDGYVQFSLESWFADGFWEKYHDGDPESRKVFEEGVNLLRKST